MTIDPRIIRDQLRGRAPDRRIGGRGSYSVAFSIMAPALAAASSDDEDAVWYFSFGPNMAINFFTGRSEGDQPGQRMMSPFSSIPGKLVGHQLAFTMMGYEACEPRFANLVALPPHQHSRMQVHGIAHRIPRSELLKLDQREGCVEEESQRAFERIEVSFEAYDVGGAAFVPPGGVPTKVYTYVAHRAKVASPAPPAQRYLDLLVASARKAGLSEEYTSWLEAQPVYKATAMQMPRPKSDSNPPRLISYDELQANRHHAAAGLSDSAWVVLGGQIFDLNAPSVARAPSRREPMLRYMAQELDATAFVLKLFARAYPSETYEPGVTHLSCLSERQRAYLASWANFFLLNRTPRVGVLQDSEWQVLTTDSSPTSPLPYEACVLLSAPKSKTPKTVLDLSLSGMRLGQTPGSASAKQRQIPIAAPVSAWAQNQRHTAPTRPPARPEALQESDPELS